MIIEEKSVGIVLKSMDFKDRQKIITLFTEGAGLIRLIVKGISKKRPERLSLSLPLTCGEFLYKRGRSDLWAYIDGTLIDPNLPLRTSLIHLRAATTLIHLILSTQLPAKPSPTLYSLFHATLHHLPHFTDPSPLLASFILKLLRHEGLLSLTPTCTDCPAPATHLDAYGSRCHAHATSSLFFSPAEWQALHQLNTAASFTFLQTFSLSPLLFQKISQLKELSSD